MTGATTGAHAAREGREAGDFSVVGAGGVVLRGRVVGHEEGPTVVLVHGYPDTSEVWAPVVAALASAHRVVTYDVRGAGRSDAPRGEAVGDGYGLDALMIDLAAVLDHVAPAGRQVHLVGHDWGAIQGWEAVTRPALAARLASFTALSAPGFDDAGRWLARRVKAPTPKHLADLAAQVRRSWYVAFFQVPRLPEALWALGAPRWGRFLARREGVTAAPAATLRRDATNGLALYRANKGRVLAPEAGASLVRTAILTGERDGFVSPRFFADRARDVSLTVLPRAGHWLPLTHAREVAAHVASFVRADGARSDAGETGPARVIKPRRVRYDWSQTAHPWIPREPYASHAIDALSLLLPAGERWFVRVFKQALPLLEGRDGAGPDAALAAEVRGFMGQEASHAAAHAALLDELFARRGIAHAPFTDRVERLFAWLDRRVPAMLEPHWVERRVAGIAAIEHYTAILGQWILAAAPLDAHGADAEVLALLRWHGAEEVEHAHVAWSLYQRLYGSGSARAPWRRRLARLELDVVHVAIVTPLFLGLMLAGADFLMRADAQVPADARRGLAAYREAARRGLLPELWRGVVRPGLALVAPSFDPAAHLDRGPALAYLDTFARRRGPGEGGRA